MIKSKQPLKNTSFRHRVAPFLGILAVFGLIFSSFSAFDAHAEDDTPTTGISISPVSNIVSVSANDEYENTLNVTNNGSSDLTFEVYAAPYTYTKNDETGDYNLNFTNETTYSQIIRWITFKDDSGAWVETATYTIAPNETKEVEYKITTPASIPDGGQYAVIFAHTLSNSSSTSSGVKTEASPGMILYARGNGETIQTAVISDLKIAKTIESKNDNGVVDVKNHINASAKVRNDGNTDFNATGIMKVESIFGFSTYETDLKEKSTANASVIPEAEMTVRDEWEDTPFMGVFKVTWTVSAAGEEQSIDQVVFILPASVIIIFIILLTIIIVWIIFIVRKKKERKSRYMV